MIKSCHCNMLGKINMIPNRDRTNNSITDTYTCVMTYDNISYGIVNAAKRFDDTIISKTESTIWGGIHPHIAMNDGMSSPMLIERGKQTDIPSRSCLHLIHDEVIKDSLQHGIRLQFGSYFVVIHTIIICS